MGTGSSKHDNIQESASVDYSKPHFKTLTRSRRERKRTQTHRRTTCKYRDKCPALKRITKQHTYTISDLNHLTEFSHPRKKCNKEDNECQYKENLLNGGYDLRDLCHCAVFVHKSSRFITSFESSNKKNKKAKKNLEEKENNLNKSKDKLKQNKNLYKPQEHKTYSSLQVPRAGGKDGLESYKKLGVMICDGSACQSPITRGLWKCWCFRDLIWNYKYRRYRKDKDPYYNKKNKKQQSKSKENEEELEQKDISKALITMVESVIALAGEIFLEDIHSYILSAKEYNKNKHKDNKYTKNNNNFSNNNNNNNNINNNSDILFNNDESNKMDKYQFKLGQLLLYLSNIARKEFGFPDNEFPIIRKGKKWQNPFVYGVLLGIVNSKLSLNVNKYDENIKNKNINDSDTLIKSPSDIYSRKKRRNLRQELFTIGCKHGYRTLFEELEANNFKHLLTIPKNKYLYDNNSNSLNDFVNNNSNKNSINLSKEDKISSNINLDNMKSSVKHQDTSVKNDYKYIKNSYDNLQELVQQHLLSHPRHLQMNCCLEEEEFISILLLTGTKIGYNIIEAHRKYRDYCKWRVLQNSLLSALTKLCKYDKERLPTQFFHGLRRGPNNENKYSSKNTNFFKPNNNKKNGYRSPSVTSNKSNDDDFYLFTTFISTTLDHRLIESAFKDRKDGALLFLDRCQPIICADISWISKFSFEHEVLLAPCALTLPSPFQSTSNNKNKSRKHTHSKSHYHKHKHHSGNHIHTHNKKSKSSISKSNSPIKSPSRKIKHNNRKYSKSSTYKKYSQKSTYNRNLSMAELSYKSKSKSPIPSSLARDRYGGLKFSLVDGKLEALSMDSTVSQSIGSSILMSDRSNFTLLSDKHNISNINITPTSNNKNEDEIKDNVDTSPLIKNKNNIDLHIVADFLFGNLSREKLWNHVINCDKTNNYININTNNTNNINNEMSIEKLQQLFFAFFVFGIQMEANNVNVRAYLPQCKSLAEQYAINFTNNVTNDIGGKTVITKDQFINHADLLHNVYETFVNDMLHNLVENDENNINNNNNNNTNNSQSVKENKNTKSGLSRILTKQSQEDNKLLSNVNAIKQYCTSKWSLMTLWKHFVDTSNSSKNVLNNNNIEKQELDIQNNSFMNYIEFDVLVYAALAYFVSQRNPDAPLASRQSLDPLVYQLRMSLLSAYDPECRGFVTYEAFKSFGEYLQNEYRKLRGSLAQNINNNNKQIKDDIGTQEYFDEYESDEFVDDDEQNDEEEEEQQQEEEQEEEQEENGSDDELYDEYEYEVIEENNNENNNKNNINNINDSLISNGSNDLEDDLETLCLDGQQYLGILQQNVDQLISGIKDNSINIDVNEFIVTCKSQCEQILLLIREIEVRVNNLDDSDLRYKYAKRHHSLDVKRNELLKIIEKYEYSY